ncbi:MAG: heparinase II/III family protein [Mycoplasmatales bacterium]
MKTIDLLLENKFRFDQKFDLECDRRIVQNIKLDWGLTPFGDREWTFVLNRMEYLYLLAEAGGKYQKHANYLVYHWLKHNNLTEQYQRTIDTAMRITVWADLYATFEESGKKQILSSIKNQINYIDNNFLPRHYFLNWGIIQVCSLLYVNHKLQLNLSNKSLWIKQLKQMLMWQMSKNYLHGEASIMYHIEVIRQLNKIMNIENCEFVLGIIQQAKRTLNTLKLNSGYYPAWGDSDYFLVKDVDEYINNDEQLENNLTTEGIIKFATTKFSGLLLNTKFGGGHGHFDNNHLELCYKKQSLFFDPGRYTYTESKARLALKNITLHNSAYFENLDIKITTSWKTKGTLEVYPLERFETDEETVIISKWQSQKFKFTRILWVQEQIIAIIDYCDTTKQIIQSFNINNEFYYSQEKLQTKADSLFIKSNGQVVLKTKFGSQRYNESFKFKQYQNQSSNNLAYTILSSNKIKCSQEYVVDNKQQKLNNFICLTINDKTLIIAVKEKLNVSIPYYYQQQAFLATKLIIGKKIKVLK